jgi:WD40 repeat protein
LIIGRHRIEVRDLATGEVQRVLDDPGPRSAITCVVAAPDGKTVVGCSGREQQDVVFVWDMDHPWPRSPLTTNGIGPARSAAIMPDNRTLVVGYDDHRVRVWDLAARRLRQTLLAQDLGRVRSVALTPDGKSIVVGAERRPRPGGKILVWELPPGSLRTNIDAPDVVDSVAVSRDGLSVFAVANGTLRRWSVATGEEEMAVRPSGRVVSLALTPDGMSLMAGLAIGKIEVWDLTTRRLLRTLDTAG